MREEQECHAFLGGVLQELCDRVRDGERLPRCFWPVIRTQYFLSDLLLSCTISLAPMLLSMEIL